jgi:hypothetical protein
MKRYHEYVRKARNEGHSYLAIAKTMRKHDYPLTLVLKIFFTLNLRRNLEISGMFAIIGLLMLGFAFNRQGLTGLVVQSDQVEHTLEINKSFNESQIYILKPEVDGELTSLTVSGYMLGGGSARVSLVSEERTYLIYDSGAEEGLGLLTGNAILESNTSDLVEHEAEVIPEIVILNKSNIVPIEEQENLSVADPSLNLSVEENMTKELQGEEVNESLPDPIEENTQSGKVTFNRECAQSCLLSLNQTQYVIRIEVEGAVLHIDSLDYLERIMVPPEAVVEEPVDNITEEIAQPGQNETITEFNLTNVTIMPGQNITLANVTQMSNITNASNISVVNVSTTALSQVIAGEPVLWKALVNTSLVSELILPKETFNITLNESAVVDVLGQELTLEQYNDVKESDLAEKEFTEYSKKEAGSLEKAISLGVKAKELKSKVKMSPPTDDIKLKFKEKKGVVELFYFTEGPSIAEEQVSMSKKVVTISSDIHYTDILAYSSLDIEAPRENIDLVWLAAEGRIPIAAQYLDTNGNGLVDRLEWSIPHLSNQSYEISITVLNIQSYPMVGGYWTVSFTTTGVADLVISGEDGTDFGVDIVHDSLNCNGVEQNITQDGNAIIVHNFTCGSTAYHRVRVLTTGKHTRKFDFGGAIAYAYNDASQLPKTMNIQGKLTNSTDNSLINQTVTMVFRIYTAFAGGSPLWSETQTVAVDDGIYDTILGKVTPLNLRFNQSYFMSIEVNSDGEMSPRINLTNAPYSFMAESALNLSCVDCIGGTQILETSLVGVDADTLDALDSSDFCQADGTNCPEGATASPSPWTNNSMEIYPDTGFPANVNITGEFRINGAEIFWQGNNLIIRG